MISTNIFVKEARKSRLFRFMIRCKISFCSKRKKTRNNIRCNKNGSFVSRPARHYVTWISQFSNQLMTTGFSGRFKRHYFYRFNDNRLHKVYLHEISLPFFKSWIFCFCSTLLQTNNELSRKVPGTISKKWIFDQLSFSKTRIWKNCSGFF